MSQPAFLSCLAGSVLLASMLPASADQEYPTFKVHFSDGIVSPSVIEVPANSRFKLELRNDGSTPIEFESTTLRKEKVLAPGASSFIVFHPLDPGNYAFFDDFHLDMPPARIVAR